MSEKDITAKMQEIMIRIKNRRNKLGISYQILADKTGLSKSTLQRYETGYIKNMPLDKVELIAKALYCSPAYLMGWEVDNEDGNDLPPKTMPISKIKLPLLGNVACGEPRYANSDFQGYIETSSDTKADFCLRASGDSMIGARIQDGDIVFIRRQPDVDDGEIALVLIDDEATLKRVYKMPGRVQLRPENPKYVPLDYSEADFENVRILGKAVSFQGDIR